LADRHESGLVHDDGAPAQRGLQRCVDEQLLERVRMRGQFAAEHVGRAGRGRATEDPAPGALDAGDDGAQAGGLAGAGVALENGDAGTRPEDGGNRRLLVGVRPVAAGRGAQGRTLGARPVGPADEFLLGLESLA
jgi:hypothetical protein